MAFPESPGAAEEYEVVGAWEVADVLGGGIDGQLDDIGAADKLCAGEVVVLRVSREGTVVED